MKEKKLPQLFVERETFEKNDKTKSITVYPPLSVSLCGGAG